MGGVNNIPGGYAGPGSVASYVFSASGPTDDGGIKPEHKDGAKPMGTVSRSTGGDISTPIPDLIDQNHTQTNLGVNFKNDRAFAQASYYGSYFRNNVPSMSWQNWA